jgi:RNA polymerase sigma-70 factor (ECF subfamily)
MTSISGTLRWPDAITDRMPDAALGVAPPSDAELMRRTAAGDREAFAVLYRRHNATVYRFARLMTGSETLAEDVVQDVFLVLMRNADRYDAERSALSTYLYGVARRHTRRRLALEHRFVAIDDERRAVAGRTMINDAGTHVERLDDVLRLRRAIVSLPSRYREVLVLCELHEVSYADAALALGCAIGTIRSRLHRARHLLARKMLTDRGEALARGSIMRCTV